MMTFLRSQSQTVLVVILAIIGVGFIFYGNSGSFLTAGNSQTDFGRIDGEDLSVADLYNAVRNTRHSLVIGGQRDLTQAQVATQAWSRLLLLHEAAKLHIDVSDKQLITFIQGLAPFQKDGVYSPELYQRTMSYLQNTYRITPDTYAALMHDELRIVAVQQALLSPIHAPGSDAPAQYEKFYGPAQISYVTFRPDGFTGAIAQDKIEEAYKADPMNPAYRTEEKRKVDYVIFPLTAEQGKLPEKEKNAAIQALGEKALDFALAFQPDPGTTNAAPAAVDFQAEAQKRGLDPVTSDFFTAGTPPANLPASPAFNNTAFSLTKDDPISKVVQLDNGVVVLHLAEIQPSELKPLEQVKPAIEKELRAKQGVQVQLLASDIAAVTLRKATEKDTSFAAAAAAQHLTVETLSAFVPAKAPQSDPRLQTIAYASSLLAVGEVSKPIPIESDKSIVILYLESRAKADPAGLDAFATRFRESIDRQLRSAASADWVSWASRQPGTHPPPRLADYGGVE